MPLKAFTAMRDILDSFKSQPGRLLLSYLAITVGMIALTVLLAVLDGLNRKASSLAEELGVRVIAILREDAGAEQNTGMLTRRHRDVLQTALPHCTVSAARGYSVTPGGSDEPVTVMAVDHRFFEVKNMTLTAGRFLDPWDTHNEQRHAVISSALSIENQWNVGSIFSLNRIPFTVVGIVQAEARPEDQEGMVQRVSLGERVVFISEAIRPYWETADTLPEPYVDAIGIKVPTGASYSDTLEKAQDLFEQPDLDPGPVSWVTPDQLMQGIRKIQRTIQFTAGSIAILCLILGGTTLMSLMVANVRDRITEIGLRRALGATRADIASLFVLEGCVITAAAAVTGTVISGLLLAAGSSRLPVPVSLGVVSTLLPIAAAVVLGVAFSYWPARSAARISPADALRND